MDATGVQDMPALGCNLSGHRLVTEGCVRPEEKGMAGQES
jgi:hypothetical protein